MNEVTDARREVPPTGSAGKVRARPLRVEPSVLRLRAERYGETSPEPFGVGGRGRSRSPAKVAALAVLTLARRSGLSKRSWDRSPFDFPENRDPRSGARRDCLGSAPFALGSVRRPLHSRARLAGAAPAAEEPGPRVERQLPASRYQRPAGCEQVEGALAPARSADWKLAAGDWHLTPCE